jgi:hypothetical protein
MCIVRHGGKSKLALASLVMNAVEIVSAL